MIGVFLCDCGTNIAGAMDLAEVARRLEDIPGLRVYRHPFMCSEDGQDLVRGTVEAGEVDRVVVAACSPRHHGDVFLEAVGDLPGAVEPVMANIREHCAWVTPDPERATAKALALVRAAIARVVTSEALGTFSVPVTDAVAVVGGGISGMHAALELASRGTRVILVERGPTLGGLMILLNRTFPTDDCSICSIAPVLSDVAREPGIEVHALTEVTGLSGRPGAWTLTLTTRPRYVSEDRCTACGDCVASTFEPEAPLRPGEGRRLIDRIAIDHEACTLCGTCAKVCEASTKGDPALTLAEGCEGPGELSYDTGRCVGCWACLEACPEGALSRVAVCPPYCWALDSTAAPISRRSWSAVCGRGRPNRRASCC